MIQLERAPLLWICGATCVGKSTVGQELYLQVMRSGIKTGYIDADQIGFCLPTPRHDPGGHRLRQRNLQAIWQNFRAAGAECLVVAGSVGSHEEFSRYIEALTETEPILCRLGASASQLRNRVFSRGRGTAPSLPGDDVKGRTDDDLDRIARQAVRAAEQLEHMQLGDLQVDTDHQSVPATADRIRRRTLSGRYDRTPEPTDET